jgi:hypothetical protein
LFLVAKVRTLHCQKQFAADVANWSRVDIAHSPSSWITQLVFLEYLFFPRRLTPVDPACLFLDQ